MKRYTPAAAEIWKAEGAERQALLDAADDITRVQALDLIANGDRIKTLTFPPRGHWLGVTYYPRTKSGDAAEKWFNSPEGQAAIAPLRDYLARAERSLNGGAPRAPNTQHLVVD